MDFSSVAMVSSRESFLVRELDWGEGRRKMWMVKPIGGMLYEGYE